MLENDFVRIADLHRSSIAGFDLPDGWWSRGYEYAFALNYARTGAAVANMGCGWTYRPLTDALSYKSGIVYSIDMKPPTWNFRDYPTPDNVKYLTADFSQKIEQLEDESLDLVFCISVLEEAHGAVAGALSEFARVLLPGGLAVITFDVPYDDAKPLGKWKGLPLDTFIASIPDSLKPRSEFNEVKGDGLLVHEEWNLTPYHCVLVKQ